ncbi:hypothetical protein PR202_gb00795 [Eleusine coracana subsp. coracana]|uniref:Uncharacterized protein n=1 Tax=Eleusine coracana subsp. coracana TaxID=191504 RepID=A0AAV5DV69_ELECO|nr:hypothetical protein PR202_gb00795 [Eleusine coracana subsp. coracana]
MASGAVAASSAMAAATTTSAFSPALPSFQHGESHRKHRASTSRTVAYSARHFRRVNPSTNPNLSRGREAPAQTRVVEDGLGALEAELWRLRHRVELRLHRLAAEANEAYRDLSSAVRVVSGDRVVLTFRRSSLRFAAGALLWSLALAVTARVLAGLALRAWGRGGWGRGWWGGGGGSSAVVRRRDRSLGGKEVVVAVSSPVSAAPTSRVPEPARVVRRRDTQVRLPKWWPPVEMGVTEPGPEMEKWARLANRLVRAIIDNRITGRDYRYDDAIQLRQLCKISGVKVSFDTENARDSFYRAAVNFVLDDCSKYALFQAAQDIGAAQINGENPREFLPVLLTILDWTSFGLPLLYVHRLRFAHVHVSCNAGYGCALEVQEKHPEALDELVKICRIHYVFPPEEKF